MVALHVKVEEELESMRIASGEQFSGPGSDSRKFFDYVKRHGVNKNVSLLNNL